MSSSSPEFWEEYGDYVLAYFLLTGRLLNIVRIDPLRKRLSVEIPPPDGLVRVSGIDNVFSDLQCFREVQFYVFVYLCVVPLEQQMLRTFRLKPYEPFEDPVCGCEDVFREFRRKDEHAYRCSRHKTEFVVFFDQFPFRNTVLMRGNEAYVTFAQLEEFLEFRDPFVSQRAALRFSNLFENVRSVCGLDFETKITYAERALPDRKCFDLATPFRLNEQARLFLIDQLNYLPPIGNYFPGGSVYRNVDPERIKDYGILLLKDFASDEEERQMKLKFIIEKYVSRYNKCKNKEK